MGCVSSCFRADGDDDEDVLGSAESPVFRYCICLRCLILPQQFYTVLFQRGQLRLASSSVQGTTSPDSLAEDSSIPDSYRAPPRPLPYDDARFSSLPYQQEGIASRVDKGSSQFHQECEPLHGINVENAEARCKVNGSNYEGEPKTCLPQSSMKFPSKEVPIGVMYVFSSSEDEDVCPTCLEEYTPENPRITMQCSHHFHLGCIYEWMERSEACPVCGKAMVFNETD